MPDSTSQPQSEPKNRGLTADRHAALLEQRYDQASTSLDRLTLALIIGAGLCLGAATYGQYILVPPSEYRSFLVLVGLVAIGLSVYRMTSNRSQVLVGDAGVAVERGGEHTRLLWWEIKSIRYEAEALVLVGANTSLRLSSSVHTQAIRAILKEAVERLPSILDVPAKLVDELPKLKDASTPAAQTVRSLQIAGKRCAASQQVITFERDARLCPNCTSVYHRSKLPKTCVTCKRELGKNAVAL